MILLPFLFHLITHDISIQAEAVLSLITTPHLQSLRELAESMEFAQILY